MNEKKFIILIVFITLVILSGGVVLVSQTSEGPKVTASKNARAQAKITNADWGAIPMNKGNVTKQFIIKNTGSEKLSFYNIRTSCHCTKAQLKTSTDESPLFGMDGFSSWTGEVAPGQQATLVVIFDPAYHGPQGVGPINRYVSLETNDSANSKLTFTVTGTVVRE